jgi:uncharacterized delta-60 repeat protein
MTMPFPGCPVWKEGFDLKMKNLLKVLLLFFLIGLGILPARLSAQSGLIDESFGEKGMVTINTDPWEWISDMIIQPDHKILIATSHELWRFDSLGNWDMIFGNHGKVTIESGTDVWVNDIAYTKDHQILVTGKMSGQNSDDLLVMRLNDDGTPDRDFGANGMVIYGYQENTFEEGIKVIELQDSRILVGANIYNLFLYTDKFSPVFLLKFRADGTLDPSFGNGGIAFQDTLGFGMEMHDMELQEDGKILAAGYAYLEKDGVDDTDFWIYRTNSDGSRDTGFGRNGSAILDMMLPNDSVRDSNTHDNLLDIGFQSDGKIIALGRKFYITEQNFITWLNNMVYDTYEMVMTRLNADGSQDLSFGENGIVEGAIHFQNNYHLYYSLQIDPEDRILVGQPSKFNKEGPDFVVSRYLKEGILDNTFGYMGSAWIHDTGSEAVKTIQLQYDRLIAAGSIDSFGQKGGEDGLRIVKYITEGKPLSLNDTVEDGQSLNVYPNPIKEVLQITFRSMAEKIQINVFDISGTKKIGQFFTNKQEIRIHTDILTSGIYILQINYDEQTYIGKVFK